MEEIKKIIQKWFSGCFYQCLPDPHTIIGPSFRCNFKTARKASVNKKCNSRIYISNIPTFYALQMNFRGRFFSAVYHPQGDEKVRIFKTAQKGYLRRGLSRKKFDRESSSKVHKMLGCLKCKYENCIFIC